MKRPSTVAITYPIIGLISIAITYIFAHTSTGLNVHSGEIFIWLAMLLGLGIMLPAALLIKSLKTIQFKLREPSVIRTYSVILTTVLGVTLMAVLLLSLLTILK